MKLAEILELILNHPLGVVLLLLPLAIVAKNIAGAFHGIQTQKWNVQFFLRGIFKGLALYTMFALLALMSWLSRDLSVSVGGTEYTLVQALVVIISAGIAIYIRDIFIMIQAIFVAPTTEEK